MPFHRFLAACFLAAFALLPPAAAETVTHGVLQLADPWARATPPGAPTGGGYLTIVNTGAEPDRLVAVETPQAGRSEIHEMKVTDGVMTMRPVADGVEIPPGGSVTLAPGGFHLMFMGLKAPLVSGESLPVRLTFEKAGTVDAVLEIFPIGSPGPDDSGAKMDMDMKP